MPATTSANELLGLIGELNADAAVHGILVQLPLPPQIDVSRIIAAVDPAKDVDGFHPLNAGRLASGLPALAPCTPVGCIKLAKAVHASLSGLDAVVIGRSNIVGKPLAQLLLNENATVTICHSKTRDLPGVCRGADILVAAIGKAGMITKDFVRPGAVVDLLLVAMRGVLNLTALITILDRPHDSAEPFDFAELLQDRRLHRALDCLHSRRTA